MPAQDITAIILAAGKGTRMKSDLHKVLHPIGGKPILRHLLDTVSGLAPARTLLVVGMGRDQVAAAAPDVEIVTQAEQLGTGHAVLETRDAVGPHTGDVIVLYGDVPFIPLSVMQAMIAARHATPDTGLVVLGFRPADPGRYGRLVQDADGALERIVEYKDANAEERAIGLCNSGMMVIDGAHLYGWLDQLENDNAAGEYYLTDLVAVARQEGHGVAVVEATEDDVLGVNSRADLALAERFFQAKKRQEAMDAGVTLTDPDSVYFSHDTVLGRDVSVEPNVVFAPGVTVEDGVTIKAFSHLEGTTVRAGASVGPFARLRPGADIGAGAKIGNFVEIKKATLDAGVKVSHLSYIGDATIGADANIGAGTITCNYDGFLKFQTTIGAGAFIGSNTALVAPVNVGAGAMVGAGSVITADVPDDALAVARGRQEGREGFAKTFRERQAAKKAEQKKGN
ncbi:bifunctional UDP-N-acetylglucosamine diphosphorylase/glucosamine-1-phosphate N-acetyltransferase GlmU [Kordiimonas marina]|uniref:bifunctional UDP-N-acetylglucosamine diphosphorylase/glucosamine-1-phosphate N-acetyltransferase GlmU n=1 Tax=Kordiimonas marina TaxID=2872312 RepID=UPI001FF453B4|nr:bifunctional UDP-N-acetylglucosamine diphosphorylase/glucosamine-1-phosphate N-acetyltransferase GlmU [Kordiimonas marina]MCJ9429742.1 bifunctional UDP-N-acetylglucosamine diphosphorylase/glucosamine-1-phosphate N-acetyltransferase GlmU [Kordiimonas marina]